MFAKNTHRPQSAKKGNYQFRHRVTATSKVNKIELNPETDATRSERRRNQARTGFKWAVALITIMLLGSLAKLVVKEAFLNDERFQLKQITVHTEGLLTRDEIIAASGLQEGMNMLMISLRSVHDKVESLPQVKSAKVSRTYPGLVTLEVEQRQAVAWLECPQKLLPAKARGLGCLLDAEGHVLPNFSQNDTREQLPIITVEDPERLVPGQTVQSTQVLAALRLLRAHQESPINHSLELLRIDATKKIALQAIYNSKTIVTFSQYEMEKQLRKLERVVEEATQRHRSLATVNLLVEQNVPVTFRESGAAPTTASNPSKGTLNSRQSLAASR
jgi:cell division septal protein FtsQ